MFAIESENVVGYQKIAIPTGYSLFTVTFQDVVGGEYDLKDITPLDANGNTLTSSMAKIKIQKMDSSGAYLTIYNYNTLGGRGWCQGMTALTDGQVTFKDGESFCINNGQGAEVMFQVQGAVNLAPQSTVLSTGFSLTGNMTPVTVDLKDIVPCDANGNALTSSMAKIKVQKMDETGAYLTIYNYNTLGGRGWCQGMTALTAGQVTLEPGESICVNNGQGEPIILKFPSPLE